MGEFLTASAEEAGAIWDQIHALYFEDVVVIKIGDYFEHHISVDELEGYANMPEPFFWNVSLSD